MLLPALMLRFGRNTRTYHGDPCRRRDARAVARLPAARARRARVAVVLARRRGRDRRALRRRRSVRVRHQAAALRGRRRGRPRAAGCSCRTTTSAAASSGRTFIAADRARSGADDRRGAARRDAQAAASTGRSARCSSILDAVPADQAEKLAVLAEIRALLDDDALDALDDARAHASSLELRPPDDARADHDRRAAGRASATSSTEKDGTIGYLISIRPSKHARRVERPRPDPVRERGAPARARRRRDRDDVGLERDLRRHHRVDRTRRPARDRRRGDRARHHGRRCSSAATAARSPCWSRRRGLAADGRGVRAARPAR